MTTAAPEPRRIIVRGVNWLGDAVMTTPALGRLRERFPQARIALLTTEKLADLWRDNRSVDSVLTFAPKESPLKIGRRLREENFDAALVLPNSPRSALEVWAAGIPRRIGYAGRWRRWLLTEIVEHREGCLTTRKRSAREIKRLVQDDGPAVRAAIHASGIGAPHHLHQYLRLAAAMGANPEPLAPLIEVAPAHIAAARSRFLQAAAGGTPGTSPVFLGLNPSAAYGEAKRWPIQNFAAMVSEVSRAANSISWLAFGGSDDRELCDAVARMAGVPVLNLAGKTSLRELMALLSVCRAVVTNDSGPMHLAAALGTEVVAIFGSTAPELTAPGLPGDSRHKVLRSDAVCSPCFRRTCPIDFRCMNGISVGQVSAAVLGALRETESQSKAGR